MKGGARVPVGGVRPGQVLARELARPLRGRPVRAPREPHMLRVKTAARVVAAPGLGYGLRARREASGVPEGDLGNPGGGGSRAPPGRDRLSSARRGSSWGPRCRAFARGLGSTNTCATAVDKKPFSASVLQDLSRVFATTTKICADGGSGRARALNPSALTAAPSYSSGSTRGAFPPLARSSARLTGRRGAARAATSPVLYR